jgi:transcriptional regulator with XRE-family HTH domain/predicted GIY-YIG superfamily endonuclease
MNSHVLYRMFDADNRLLYVGLTNNPKDRFGSHRSAKHWWSGVATITLETFSTPQELVAAERAAIENEKPLHNILHNQKPRSVNSGEFSHPYRSLIQKELAARCWRQSDLARASGLHRALISKILADRRPRLGQMPDDATIQGIAKGFGLPADKVRKAAAESLIGYLADYHEDPLEQYSTDYLLDVIRRRFAQQQHRQEVVA